MDTQISFILKSCLDSVNKSFLSDHIYTTISRFGKSFWVFVSTFIFTFFELIIKHIIRSKDDGDGRNTSNSGDLCHEHEEQNLNFGYTGLNSNGFSEKEDSEFYFGFKFQFGDVFDTKIAETESSVLMENEISMSTSKYSFESAKDIVGVFMEEPKIESFTVHESFVGSNEGFIDHRRKIDSRVEVDKINQELVIQEDFIGSEEGSEFHAEGSDDCTEFQKVEVLKAGEKTEDSVFSAEEAVLEGEKGLDLGEKEVVKKEQVNWLADNFLNTENFSYGLRFLSENEFSLSDDSNLESDDSSYGFSISPGEDGSGDYSFFRDEDEDGDEEIESDYIGNPVEEIKGGFIDEVPSLDDGDKEDEFIKLQPNLEDSSELVKETPVLEDHGRVEEVNEVEKPEKSWEFDSDDEEDEYDALLEHQTLVEQMKMDLKNSRCNGLPTILEEFETTKIAQDLKPLKIDEKIEHGDRMEQIQKFYKSYAERMRKLDVLNYQTLQAISFLQMKHPAQLNSGEKSPFSDIKSRFLPNFWSGKLRRIYYADPTLKSIEELHKDLEVVYVGQVCLSWEILRWQHGKAKEFQEYDSEGIRSYNQVAGEFQQFQVLVQRFTEDEAFQGPRMQNYVKKRCDLRTLLQVPTIKDDLKDKKGKRQDDEYAISMAMLAELIEESMSVFWLFLHADKDCSNFISKALQGSHASIQDPADLEMFMDIKSSLQKKEKRLKVILRTGNCLVKKFQKPQGARLDIPLFLSQVELRLVSRVLSLQRLSHDQLIWCRTKLNNINFVDRTKIHIEPLFLLFPC